MSEVDPVCGMVVENVSKYKSLYKGKVYYFCSAACKKEFDRDAEAYLNGAHRQMGCCRRVKWAEPRKGNEARS